MQFNFVITYKPGNRNTVFFVLCVSNSRTATTATQTNLRFVMYVTWSSPPPWWLSRTTRAKFTPRTWDWSPLLHRLHVCISSALLLLFVSSFLFLSLLLLVSSSLSSTSSSSGPEETSRGSQQRAGRRRWRQRRLQPFLRHVPGVVQQPAHGPAALRRQETQKADDKDEADGDVRAGHSSRSERTAATLRSPLLTSMSWFCPVVRPASTLKGYPCTICKIELNSVEQYQSHISGAKHNNQ